VRPSEDEEYQLLACTSARSARREGPQNLIPTVTASIIMASCVLYLVFVKYELNTYPFDFRRGHRHFTLTAYAYRALTNPCSHGVNSHLHFPVTAAPAPARPAADTLSESGSGWEA
jgi:hypothetical protein